MNSRCVCVGAIGWPHTWVCVPETGISCDILEESLSKQIHNSYSYCVLLLLKCFNNKYEGYK